MTIKTLVELAQAIEDGKEIEYLNLEWHKIENNITLASLIHRLRIGELRIKPEEKIIDLSVLIDGIDCEFWSSSSEYPMFPIGKLLASGDSFYESNDGVQYQFCVPRTNHIHYWTGGDCPLPKGFRFRVFYRDGTSYEGAAPPVWEWHHSGVNSDIIGFEVLGKADGWIYPWESE